MIGLSVKLPSLLESVFVKAENGNPVRQVMMPEI